MPARPQRPLRGLAASALTVLVLGSTACSADDTTTEPQPAPTSSTALAEPSTSPEPEPVTTKATVGRVVGGMQKKLRTKMRDRVAGTVDRWIDAAYGGDYPRADFDDAFSVFTEGAQRRAKHDRAELSNADLGAGLDAVTFTQRRIRIDVLASRGKAVAVTARVAIGMDLEGETASRQRVVGSLYLTYSTGGWHVFAYDLDRKEV